jgi:hypothetical protein
MKVKMLFESESTPKLIVKDILSTMERHPLGRQADVDSDIEEKNNYAEGSIRYWGKWRVPAGEEDDGDYDWEEMDENSKKTLSDEIKKISTRYPKVKITFSAGEKNYIYIRVETK